MTSPIMMQGSSAVPSTSALNFGKMVSGYLNGSFGSTALNVEIPFPTAGTIQNLRVYFPTQPGNTSGSYDVGLAKTGAKTALVCNVATASNTCSDTNGAHAITVAAGDLVAWFVCPSNTATCTAGNAPTSQAGPVQISATFTSTANNEGFVLGSFGGNMSATVINYGAWQGATSGNTTEANVSSVIPAAGVLDNLRVALSNTPGASADYAITVFLNGSATGLTCVVASAGTTCSDTTGAHAITVARGDKISISSCPSSSGNTLGCTGSTGSAAPTARALFAGMRWVPTTQGQAIIMATPTTVPPTTGTRYNAANGAGQSNATETNDINVVPVAMTMGNLTVAQSTAPGGVTTRAWTLRAGAGGGASQGDQTPVCTVTSAATTCTDGNTYAATAGQAVDISAVATGTNAAQSWVKMGMTVTIP